MEAVVSQPYRPESHARIAHRYHRARLLYGPGRRGRAMSEQTALPVNAPSLPKGGGAVHSIGKGLGTVGAHGAASYEIALPISPGRGFAPSLSLSYSSSAGNGVFGIG